MATSEDTALAEARDALDAAMLAYVQALIPMKQLPRDEWPASIAVQSVTHHLKELSDAVDQARAARDAHDGKAG